MGSRKGLSTMLWIVVAAVIVVVVALVLLTIFGRGIGPIGSLADYKQQCNSTAVMSCSTTGYLPMNWHTEVYIGNEQTSCDKLLPEITACESLGFGKR